MNAKGRKGPTIPRTPPPPSDGGGAQDTRNIMQLKYIYNNFLCFFIVIPLKKVFFEI